MVLPSTLLGRRRTWVLAVAAGTLAAAAALWSLKPHGAGRAPQIRDQALPAAAGPASRIFTEPSRTETAATHAIMGEKPVPLDSSPGHSTEVAYAKTFAASSNYYEFVRATIEAARAGDRDAQFYVYRALKYCDVAYPAYFEHRGKTRTLDEALQAVSTRAGMSTELAGLIYARCHELKERDPAQWDSAADWLGRATDAGQPAAQATTATALLEAQQLSGFVAAGGVVKPSAIKGREQNPHTLLLSAVRSLDPTVLWFIGSLQGVLPSVHGEQTDGAAPGRFPHVKDRYAWWLVACSRGYDCSERAEWYRDLCIYAPDCRAGESAVEYIRRSAQVENIYDLDERVREIDAKLDTGKWDELGLNSSPDL